jgi:hypothetical protein
MAEHPIVPKKEKNFVGQLFGIIKQYKEIIGVLSAVVVAVSGAISWTVSHFATEEELSNLECRMQLKVSTQALPIHSSMLTFRIEAKWSQIASLAKETGPDALLKIEQLKTDIKDLGEERKSVDQEYKQAVNDAVVKCFRAEKK